MSKSSPSASPDAPAEEARAAEAEVESPVAWASPVLHGDVLVDDDGVVVLAPRAVERVSTVTVSTLTGVHGTEYEQRVLRSIRRQERSERRLQQQRRPHEARGSADRDAAPHSGGEEDHEDESGSSRQSLLLFIVATAILVVCMVAGLISIALLEQVERRKERVSIDSPEFD
ncbi:uncharacterized protein LOC119160073 isoform X2 [Rhipicephalus microplus]|uniref:uncharacterized protein LOC119160073 isoform X2 n=1 Tax=Rhipicephalus microplus TaxID=6941 RepID=UPI003F6AD0AD